MSLRSEPPEFKPFNLALIQLGNIGLDKDANLKHAHDLIIKAAKGDPENKPAELVVLPVSRSRSRQDPAHIIQELWNSPHGHNHFPVYAETIDYTASQPYNIATSPSPTVKALSASAKEAKVWVIGGKLGIYPLAFLPLILKSRVHNRACRRGLVQHGDCILSHR